MFYLIAEPEYNSSIWYKEILTGIISEKRIRRISLVTLSDPLALRDKQISEEDFILVASSSLKWFMNTLPICEKYFGNRIVLIANYEESLLQGNYSIVTSNIPQGISLLYDYLNGYNKKKIALYGINPMSASDMYRVRCFISRGGNENDLFYNDGSLSDCYNEFDSKKDEYDAVICVNDYAAVSLIRHLKDYEGYLIASCGAATQFSDAFSPSITRTHLNYREFGNAAFNLCNLLSKNPYIHSVKISITNSFILGESTRNLPFKTGGVQLFDPEVSGSGGYYSDPEISEMINIETLLEIITKEDRDLLCGLMSGKTYQELADQYYLSVNGVKYRLKRMFKTCGAGNRTEFEKILKKYSVVIKGDSK